MTAADHTCANYLPPTTCPTAPSSEAGRCDHCRAAADPTPSPATDGLREAVEALADEWVTEAAEIRRDVGWAWQEPEKAASRLRAILAAHPAPPSETATEVHARNELAASSDADRADEGDDDGPECETCGKTTCPDADLPGFSEPVNCAYKPIFDALRDSKDCDYGCARDLTNQGVRLEVVPAVERILAARLAEVERERDVSERAHASAAHRAADEKARADALGARGTERVEWGVRDWSGGVTSDRQWSHRDDVRLWLEHLGYRLDPLKLVRRTVTEFAPIVGEWEPVEEGDRG